MIILRYGNRLCGGNVEQIASAAQRFYELARDNLVIEGVAECPALGLYFPGRIMRRLVRDAAHHLYYALTADEFEDGEQPRSLPAHYQDASDEQMAAVSRISMTFYAMIRRWGWCMPGDDEPPRAEDGDPTIRPDELEAFRWSLERLPRVRDVAVVKMFEAADNKASIAVPKSPAGVQFSKKALIIGVFAEHPDWSNHKIATETGACVSHVCTVLKAKRAHLREMHRGDKNRGWIDRNGQVDALSG